MCNHIDLDVPRPDYHFRLAEVALRDCKAAPGDWEKFEALDFVMRVLAAKWSAYSLARRVSACREDGVADRDEVVDLLG